MSNEKENPKQICPFCKALVECKLDHSLTCKEFQALADLFEAKLKEELEKEKI